LKAFGGPSKYRRDGTWKKASTNVDHRLRRNSAMAASDARLRQLEIENASLSAAADEAGVLLEELAADGKRLRARIADLDEHAGLSAEIEVALRASVAELSAQLETARSSIGTAPAPPAHPIPTADLIDALTAYMPEALSQDARALRALAWTSTAHASTNALRAAGVGKWPSLSSAVAASASATGGALVWLLSDPTVFHVRGDELAPHMALLDERLAATTAAFDPHWTDSVVRFKSAVVQKAADAVVSVLLTSGSPLSVDQLSEFESCEPVHIDVKAATAVRAATIRSNLEKDSDALAASGRLLLEVESRAVVAERALAVKSEELDDATVRCAVFEEQLRACEEEVRACGERANKESRYQSDKLAVVSEELHLGAEAFPEVGVKQVIGKEAAVELGAGERRAMSLQRAVPNAELTGVRPSDALFSAVNDATEEVSANASASSIEIGTGAVSHELVLAELVQSRSSEARLRRALDACRLADIATDNTEGIRPGLGSELANSHKVATRHLRQARRAAACARVVQLAPVTLRVATSGTSAATVGLRRALALAREELDSLPGLPPPAAVVRAPAGVTLDRTALTRFAVSGAAVHRALALDSVFT
jgi:hypothetical protein